jgi:hypothetical protein
MKKWILAIFLIPNLTVFGQNEFGATAFYSDFNKVYSDGQTGFSTLKGGIQTEFSSDLSKVYDIKIILPLADSGKIIVPTSGIPYAIYYFEPEKVRLKADQRGVNLRDAIAFAYDKPLFARTETQIIDNHPFTNSWYFDKPDEANCKNAVFKMSIYFYNSEYYLTLEIMGKKI